MHQLVLASESPRRKQLLEEAGFSFSVFPVKVSEYLEKNLNTDAAIIAIAKEKAEAAMQTYKPLNLHNYLILAADTLVILGDQILGKPKNSTEAQQMLSMLSGQEHQVKTAIYLIESSTKKVSFGIETTKVKFKKINLEEIQSYIETGEPFGKAGSYAIQGIAKKFVDSTNGPYDNVVGLPIDLLKKLLAENNWNIK